jgi:hypothetical protein|tara:strand:+ start:2866 stop:3174 length:309 start_codon:yes stop_codon:yes gene_type:complete
MEDLLAECVKKAKDALVLSSADRDQKFAELTARQKEFDKTVDHFVKLADKVQKSGCEQVVMSATDFFLAGFALSFLKQEFHNSQLEVMIEEANSMLGEEGIS